MSISLNRFEDLGAGRSILIDKDGRIIAGNKSAEAALHLMMVALGKGMDVVVDEMNLHGSEWGLFVARAQQLHAKVVWQTMRTPIEECKRRNAQRGHPVSDMEIDRQAKAWADWLKK